MADISKIKSLDGNTTWDIKDNLAVANVTLNGTELTITRRNGTSFNVPCEVHITKTVESGEDKYTITFGA